MDRSAKESRPDDKIKTHNWYFRKLILVCLAIKSSLLIRP